MLAGWKTHPEGQYSHHCCLSLEYSQSRPPRRPQGSSNKDSTDCSCRHQDLQSGSHPSRTPVIFCRVACGLLGSGQTDLQAYNACPSRELHCCRDANILHYFAQRLRALGAVDACFARPHSPPPGGPFGPPWSPGPPSPGPPCSSLLLTARPAATAVRSEAQATAALTHAVLVQRQACQQGLTKNFC